MEQKEIAEVTRESMDLMTLAIRPIIDQASYDLAANTLKTAKAILKKIDTIYDPILKGAKDQVKAINAERLKYAAPVEEAESILRRSTALYITEQEKIRQAEERKALEEAKEKEDFLKEAGIADAVVVPETIKAIETAGIGYREVWKFEIVNPLLVPREYLAINEVLIGQAARAQKELCNIPGVRVYCEKTAVVR